MSDIVHFKYATGAITDIAFSPCGNFLATADTDRCVGLCRFTNRDEDETKPVEWIYIGKFRSHYKPITSIFFEEVSEQRQERLGEDATDFPTLYSLGEDRILHEYDLEKSTIRGGIKLANSTKVDQTAVPTACVSIPGRKITKEELDDIRANPSEDTTSTEYLVLRECDDEGMWTADTVVTVNDEFKFKVWDLSSELENVEYYANYTNFYEVGGSDVDTENDHSSKSKNIKVNRKTLLAPTYGGAINKVFVLPERRGSVIGPSQYLAYGTFSKVVGLVKLPLDGNPIKSMALIAHPGELSCVVSSFDGKYILTAGGSDRSVKLWAVNTHALEASIQLGGKGIDPYMSLIEGGRSGEFYQDMLDYFYYAQLCSQGINTTAARKITGFVPVSQVIHLMRALGYYPTQQEIMDISNEIIFSHQTHLASYRDKVDLEEFIKLYVNYRPVFGLGNKSFEAAFKVLAEIKDSEQNEDSEDEQNKKEGDRKTLSRDELCEHLQTLGEQMGPGELVGALQALSGAEYDVSEDTNALAAMLKKMLAKEYTPQSFAQDILGFEAYGEGT